MALFGKFFSKETCAICGQEAGLTTKRKVADGIICKDCEGKLSPWFDQRKESTIGQIKEQLAAREANRALLGQFKVSKHFGNNGAFFFDEEHGWFCALADASTGSLFSSDRITGVEGLRELNADVIELGQVVSARIDIVETKSEVKRSVDGEQVSYSPKHMRYGEDFWVIAQVDHPYIHTLRVSLGALTVETVGERLRNSAARKLAEWLTDDPRLNLERNAAIFDDDSLWQRLTRGGWEMPDYAYGFPCSLSNREQVQRYGYYLALSEQVRRELLGL